MSTSQLVLYGNDIKPASSLIGLLDGSEQFCISSPFFEVPGIIPEKKTDFLTKGSESQYGFALKAPSLYARPNDDSPYVKYFKIAVAVAPGIKKNFTVRKPYGAATNFLTKNKESLSMILNREADQVDEKLCLIAHQFSCVLDVLLISKILDINLTEFKNDKDNTAFYTKFCTKATEIMSSKTDLEDHKLKVTENFIKSFTKCPFYMKRDKKYGPIFDFGNPKSRMISLMNAFYKLNSDIDNSYLGEHSRLVADSSYSIPNIMKEDYLNNKTNKHGSNVLLNGIVIIKLEEGEEGYNEKMNHIATKLKCKKSVTNPLTRNDVPTLWGGTVSNTVASIGKSHTGCLYIVPTVTTKCYKNVTNTVEWRISDIIRNDRKFTPVATDVGDEFIDDDETNADAFVNKAMNGTFTSKDDAFLDSE